MPKTIATIAGSIRLRWTPAARSRFAAVRMRLSNMARLSTIDALISRRQQLRDLPHQNIRVVARAIVRQCERLADDDADARPAQPHPLPPEFFLTVNGDGYDDRRRRLRDERRTALRLSESAR